MLWRWKPRPGVLRLPAAQSRRQQVGGASASAGIGGMVLLTSHGFSGAYLGSRHSISMRRSPAKAPRWRRDYDFSSALHAADLDSPEKIGRTAGERAVERLNPRKVVDPQGARRVRSARCRFAARPLARCDQRQRYRAQDELSAANKLGQQLFARGIDIIDDPLRLRGLRSRPFDGEGVAGQRRKLVSTTAC